MKEYYVIKIDIGVLGKKCEYYYPEHVRPMTPVVLYDDIPENITAALRKVAVFNSKDRAERAAEQWLGGQCYSIVNITTEVEGA